MERAEKYSRRAMLIGLGTLIGGEVVKSPLISLSGYYVLVFSTVAFLGLNFARSRDRRIT